jgi:CBS domain-containing protein
MQHKQRFDFLATVPPFDSLSQEDLQTAAQALSLSHHYKDMTLFVQNKTQLNYVYLVFQGQLEQFILENDAKLMHTFINEREIYGGISILFNKGISIRTVRTIEDTTLFRLQKETFLALCTKNVDFTKYFTDRFGQRMLQKPYVSFIAQSARCNEDDLPPGFLNRSLHGLFSNEILTCRDDQTAQEVAQAMTGAKRSSVIVLDGQGHHSGLITDHDLRQKVVATGTPYDVPAREIMSSPLVTIPADSQVFEALLLMMQQKIKHIAVLDEASHILGIATEQDLLMAQGHSPVFLMNEIHRAESVSHMASRYRQLPGLIKTLIDNGARAGHLNRIITAFSDVILKKVLQSALEELPKPPVKFAFVVFGSEGRKEQTLKTDQDNAIIFEDVPPESLDEVQAYFLKLGSLVCSRLNEVGFAFCEYDIMAQNPKWCQPLKTWKEYFQTWIRTAEPEALLQASIFFDFRLGEGEAALVDDLRMFLFKSLSGWAGFFRHLAENALYFKPPLDFFGNLAVRSKGDLKNTLDIKSPMRLIVDFARLYALQNKIPQTNTLERLREMQFQNILDQEDHDELAHAYSYMMQMRLSHQITNMTEKNIPPDNNINPKELTHIEQQALKEALKRIRMAQGKMRMEHTQDIGIG